MHQSPKVIGKQRPDPRRSAFTERTAQHAHPADAAPLRFAAQVKRKPLGGLHRQAEPEDVR
jgi:hypothetical protein